MQAIRLVIGAFLAAVLMFFWGFFFWSVLPVSKSMMDRAENEDALIANLKGSLKGEGFYVLPVPDRSESSDLESGGVYLPKNLKLEWMICWSSPSP